MSKTSKEQAIELSITEIPGSKSESIAILSLNRPEAANAFNADIIEQMTAALGKVAKDKNCRAMILRGRGKHFCAGADLGWMQHAATLDFRNNLAESKDLTRMFEALYHLPVPTIGIAHGSIFGGAVGLIACCDITIAIDDAKFCLSEVKLGLLPAIILPYVARRMQTGPLRRYGLTGRLFGATQAKDYGLIDLVCANAQLPQILRDELTAILAGGPKAQAQLKLLHRDLISQGLVQMERTAATISHARTGDEGQAGLTAFFAKKPSPWTRTLPADWLAYDDTQDS